MSWRRSLSIGLAILLSVSAVQAQFYRPGNFLTRVGLTFFGSGNIVYDFTQGTVPTGVTGAGTNGTRTTSAGINTPASAPRLDYDGSTLASLGVLNEGPATNITLQSAFASNWLPQNATYTPNSATSPDNTTAAALFNEGTAASTYHQIRPTGAAYSTAANSSYTVSMYAKAGTGRYVSLANVGGSGGDGAYAIFDLTTCAVTQSAAFAAGTLDNATGTNVGGGWCRISVQATITTTTRYFIFSTANVGTPTVDTFGRQSFTGTSATDYMWGGQTELGPLSTYVPTAAATVTRTAEGLGFTIPANVYNLLYTFDNNSTQTVGVTPGAAYTAPIFSRTRIKTITLLPYDSDAQAVVNAFTTPATTARKITINNAVTGLKNCGTWTLKDVLYAPMAADSQAAAINWKNPGTYTLSIAAGAPTFTADRGYTGDGTASIIATGYNPTTSSLGMSLNSAHAQAVTLTNGSSVAYADIRSDNSRLVLRARIGNVSGGAITTNTTTVGTATSTNPVMTTMSRLDSATQTVYRGAAVDVAGAVASALLPTNIELLGASTSFTDRQISWASVGQGETGTQIACEYPVIKAYHSDLGVTLQ